MITTGRSDTSPSRQDQHRRQDRPGRLRLAAVNIDGVLLNDTFSPVLHRFVTSRGGAYTADLERRVFSQNRELAAHALSAALPRPIPPEQVLRDYFAEREAYLREHPVEVTPGAVRMLQRLRAAGLTTVCYGGLSGEHFTTHLGRYRHLFDPPEYVCTNAFRPGLREITAMFGLDYAEVVFIDDVASVAEAARSLGAAFIGHPSNFPHSHQAALMREAGARHVVASLDAVDAPLLHSLDTEPNCWN